MQPAKYIAYYRVSTDRQGKSGLGLEAQQQAVHSYLGAHAGDLTAAYTEVESGKRSNRPELAAALDHCRRVRATLIIAKLDRLGRNVAFIASLMESRVDFVCCDNPHANRLMLHLLAAFAEHEREQISLRTKAALQAAKARGVQLGNPKLEAINASRERKARRYAEALRPVIEELEKKGITTVRGIRAALNAQGIPTASGKGQWHVPAVHTLLKRIEKARS